MRYVMKQKLFCWGDDFTITAALRGKSLSRSWGLKSRKWPLAAGYS